MRFSLVLLLKNQVFEKGMNKIVLSSVDSKTIYYIALIYHVYSKFSHFTLAPITPIMNIHMASHIESKSYIRVCKTAGKKSPSIYGDRGAYVCRPDALSICK